MLLLRCALIIISGFLCFNASISRAALTHAPSMAAPNSVHQSVPFAVIGLFSIAPDWNGSPLTLQPDANANMLQTPTGSMVLTYQNLSPMNNKGTLSLITGGSAPKFYDAYSGTNQPNVLINNWNGSNLSITNVSLPGSNNPIQIQAIGPGMPGLVPALLPVGTINLKPGQAAAGSSTPRWMQLIMQQSSGDLGIFVIIGGPVDSSGNNAYMISVNDSVNGNTGPNTGKQPPPGYYATSASSYYTYQFNWGSSTIFIANMSGTTAAPAQITLRQL